MLLIWTKSFIRAPGQMTLANTLLPVRFVTARSYAVRTAQSHVAIYVFRGGCIGLDSCESHRIATNSTEWFVSLFRCVPFAMITWWWGWRVWNWQVIVPLSVASALGSFIYCRGFNCSMPVDAMHLFKSLCRALLLLPIFVSQSLSYQWCRDCIWWPDCGVDLCLCKWVFFLKFVLECFFGDSHCLLCFCVHCSWWVGLCLGRELSWRGWGAFRARSLFALALASYCFPHSSWRIRHVCLFVDVSNAFQCNVLQLITWFISSLFYILHEDGSIYLPIFVYM